MKNVVKMILDSPHKEEIYHEILSLAADKDKFKEYQDNLAKFEKLAETEDYDKEEAKELYSYFVSVAPVFISMLEKQYDVDFLSAMME